MSSSIFFCTLKNSFIKQWFFGVKLVEKKKQNPDKNIKIVNLTPHSDKTVCCMFQHKQLNHWKLGTRNVTACIQTFWWDKYDDKCTDWKWNFWYIYTCMCVIHIYDAWIACAKHMILWPLNFNCYCLNYILISSL